MDKMTKEDWANVEYFSPDEEWGNPFMMDRSLIYLLRDLRMAFHHPFVIHVGYVTSGHSPKSRHYVGKAVDFHIVDMDFKDAVDLMLSFLEKLGRTKEVGLGIYPDWNNPGFHLDTRRESARWGAINENGRQIYVSFTEAYDKIGG